MKVEFHNVPKDAGYVQLQVKGYKINGEFTISDFAFDDCINMSHSQKPEDEIQIVRIPNNKNNLTVYFPIPCEVDLKNEIEVCMLDLAKHPIDGSNWTLNQHVYLKRGSLLAVPIITFDTSETEYVAVYDEELFSGKNSVLFSNGIVVMESNDSLRGHTLFFTRFDFDTEAWETEESFIVELNSDNTINSIYDTQERVNFYEYSDMGISLCHFTEDEYEYCDVDNSQTIINRTRSSETIETLITIIQSVRSSFGVASVFLKTSTRIEKWLTILEYVSNLPNGLGFSSSIAENALKLKFEQFSLNSPVKAMDLELFIIEGGRYLSESMMALLMGNVSVSINRIERVGLMSAIVSYSIEGLLDSPKIPVSISLYTIPMDKTEIAVNHYDAELQLGSQIARISEDDYGNYEITLSVFGKGGFFKRDQKQFSFKKPTVCTKDYHIIDNHTVFFDIEVKDCFKNAILLLTLEQYPSTGELSDYREIVVTADTEGVFNTTVKVEDLIFGEWISIQPRLQDDLSNYYLKPRVWGEEFCFFFIVACPDENHPHAIDMGLPSGKKWVCCNVGATRPEEYGNHYAWGEVGQKSIYDWGTYKWCVWDEEEEEYLITKYTGDYYRYHYFSNDYVKDDHRECLVAEDDIASLVYGGDWGIPSPLEMKELIMNSYYENQPLNNVPGIFFINKEMGTCLFFPSSGIQRGGVIDYFAPLSGEIGYYWLNEYAGSDYHDIIYKALAFEINSDVSQSPRTVITYFYDGNYYPELVDRRYGLSVRAVSR